MRQFTFSVFLFTLVLPLLMPLSASHFQGAHIEFECVTGCTTRVNLHYYRDCGGSIFLGPASISLQGIGTNCNAPAAIIPWSNAYLIEITPVCPGTSTRCSNGSMSGVELYKYYRDYDVCNVNCPSLGVSWTECCRSYSIICGAQGQATHLTTTMDLTQGCNSTPVFHEDPHLYLCSGQVNTIGLGAYDPDGDSLSFELGPCYQSQGVICTYNPGFTSSQFMGTSWDIALDSASGDITFTPQPGNNSVGVVCIYVSEWRNGVIISNSARELQVTVISCPTNNAPTLLPITNINGGASGGLDTIYATPGTQLCFDLPTNDLDLGQTVSLYFDPFLPGAVFSDIGGTIMNPISGTNPVGRFCFTPPSAGAYQARFYVKDDFCPFYGYFNNTFTIIATNNIPVLIGNATTVNTACNQVQLAASAMGGTPPYTYSWSGGGGITSNPNNTNATLSHTFQSAGTFPVQLTITDFNGLTWSWNDSVTVENLIQGILSTSGGGVLQSQQVLLVRYNPVDSSLAAIDTTFTDGSGYYEFCTTDTLVYIKATPDSASYPTQMPTYADTALVWQNARAYFLNGSASTFISFATKFGQNPGGPGFIGGLIVNGANKQTDPVVGLELYLIGPGGVPYGSVFTDVNGYFSFPDVPHGGYEIWVNKPHINNTSAPQLTVNAMMESQDSLLFVLHDDWLELEIVTSRTAPNEKENLTISPNPFLHSLEITYSLEESAQVMFELTDLQGKQIEFLQFTEETIGVHKKTLEEPELPAGIYFLRITIGKQQYVRKLLKQ